MPSGIFFLNLEEIRQKYIHLNISWRVSLVALKFVPENRKCIIAIYNSNPEMIKERFLLELFCIQKKKKGNRKKEVWKIVSAKVIEKSPL